MFLKKFIILLFLLLGTLSNANTCPKWFPLPSNATVVVLPIYDKSITQPDLDCDGIIDTLDNDIDGDGVDNDSDAFPRDPNEFMDTDGDGIGDNAELPLPKFSSPTRTKILYENGSYVLFFYAHNADSYYISGVDAGYFTMDTYAKIRFKKSPDYETKKTYKFTVTALNEEGSDTQDITIHIRDKDDSLTWKGKLYQYVKSPKTGKVWLDRNLGADEVCKTAIDQKCYGDYYQWGRARDGHEYYKSLTTPVLADRIATNEKKFIRDDEDWLTRNGGFLGLGDGPDNDGKKRSKTWAKGFGSSICPVGFHVPDSATLVLELGHIKDKDDAFTNFLKLPSAGYRRGATATYILRNDAGILWSSRPITTNYRSYSFLYNSVDAFLFRERRSSALPVRCIKE